MEDIYVARLMSTDIQTISPETLVEDAAQTMLDEDVGSLIVTDGEGHLEGILTTTDFVDIVAHSEPKAQTTVSRYMTADVVTTSAQESIATVADVMVDRGIHHVPVVDESEGVIGILTATDLTSYLSHL